MEPEPVASPRGTAKSRTPMRVPSRRCTRERTDSGSKTLKPRIRPGRRLLTSRSGQIAQTRRPEYLEPCRFGRNRRDEHRSVTVFAPQPVCRAKVVAKRQSHEPGRILGRRLDNKSVVVKMQADLAEIGVVALECSAASQLRSPRRSWRQCTTLVGLLGQARAKSPRRLLAELPRLRSPTNRSRQP
jgi:hypothetical protein